MTPSLTSPSDPTTCTDPMTYHSAFDRRIDNTPADWRGPLTEVVDTADAIRLALKDWDISDPALLLGLTKLALVRYDRQQAASDDCPA